MTTIVALAQDQVLTAMVSPKLACNNRNTVKLHVTFSPEWNLYTARSAVFATSVDPTPYEEVLTNGECIIPNEVLADEGLLYIFARGVNASTNSVKATTPLAYKVLPGTPSLIVSAPTADVYQQLLTENAAIKARLNALSSLNEGSTTGDAELMDIRAGADGAIYETAGESVREQIAAVEAEAMGFYAETENLINRHKLVKGLLNEGTGLLMNSTDFDKYMTTGYINVVPGTSYNVRIPITGNFQRIVFYDVDGKVKSCKMLESTLTEWSVAIPDGVVRIRLSFFTTSTSIINLASIVPVGGDINAPMLGRISYDALNTPYRPNENGQITASAIGGFTRLSRNLFNKFETYDNHFLNQHNVVVTDETFKNYFISHYINVTGGQTYTLSPVWSALYYNESYEFIGVSGNVSNTTLTITVPEGCAYIRFNALISNKDKVMMCEGAELLPFEHFICKLGFIDNKPKRLYTLKDALCRWKSGEKFPIGFLGDSTTDGMGTTHGGGHESQDTAAGGWGRADYTNIRAYPYLLETLLKKGTSNTALRVYNIGYSGARFSTLIPHYDDIFGHAYADVKMVGIVLGINDRLVASEKTYYEEFRTNLVNTVEYLYGRGIQPFMVTSQAVIESHCPTTIDESTYPLRDGESIDTIANGIKREVAEEYGLEIIEMTDYGELMMTYSDIPISEICTDGVHFKDAGHILEAEYLYSVLCGRSVKVKKGDVLSYTSQKYTSDCPTDALKAFDNAIAGFKVYYSQTRSTGKDIVLQDFVVFVDERTPITLYSRCVTPNTQYVLIDDVEYKVNSTSQEIATLDVGVHRIKAMSGNSTNANWVGFSVR